LQVIFFYDKHVDSISSHHHSCCTCIIISRFIVIVNIIFIYVFIVSLYHGDIFFINFG
jgi:hypothetical protein